MSSFLLDNFFWQLYPNLKWQIPLLYFSCLFLSHHYNFSYQFSFIFIIILSLYIYPYRIPQPVPYPSHTVQICNTDGTCHNINSDSINNIYNIFSPMYGTIDNINQIDNKFIITISSIFLDLYAIYTPCSGNIFCNGNGNGNGNVIEIKNERGGTIEIKIIGWRIINTLMDEGDLIGSGKYMGMARKIEIMLPCDKVQLMVKSGERMEGFNTVMARWNH